jgi:hypothetical protein
MQEPVVPFSFLRAKPIGVMQMVDQGEQDDKIIGGWVAGGWGVGWGRVWVCVCVCVCVGGWVERGRGSVRIVVVILLKAGGRREGAGGWATMHGSGGARGSGVPSSRLR